MKNIYLLLVIIIDVYAYTYNLEPIQINKSIYCFFGELKEMDTKNNGNMVNSCFIDAGHHWAVVDPGPTYSYAKEAFTRMQRIKQQDVTVVFNTHIHDDHWLGNAFYADKNITIVGPKLFKDAINIAKTTRMQRRISPEAYALTSIVLPNQLVTQSQSMQVDSLKLQLIVFHKSAHTKQDIMLYLPSLNALFTGDLLFNGRLLSLRDGNINGWLEALELIERFEASIIIGGHGLKHDSSTTLETKQYLLALKDAINNAIDNGVDIDEATRTITLPTFKHLQMYNSLHKQNVETAYRTLEWEDE